MAVEHFALAYVGKWQLQLGRWLYLDRLLPFVVLEQAMADILSASKVI